MEQDSVKLLKFASFARVKSYEGHFASQAVQLYNLLGQQLSLAQQILYFLPVRPEIAWVQVVVVMIGSDYIYL